MIALYRDIRLLAAAGIERKWTARFAGEAMLGRSAHFLLWLTATVVAALIIGQKLALPIFVFAYLRFWGRFRLSWCVAYSLVAYLLMVAFYDRIIRLFFHEPLIATFLAGRFPGWFPEWLVL